MCTLNEQLKSYQENAESKIDFVAMNAAMAKTAAKFFAPYRDEVLKSYFADATDEELKTELKAFNEDTKNGTHLLISTYKVSEKGELLDENGEKVENAKLFAKLHTTNENGEVTKTKFVYSCEYMPHTCQRNNRIIAYWLEYRETVDDSFAAQRAAKVAAAKVEINKLSDDVVKLATDGKVNSEEFIAAVARIQELKTKYNLK